MVVVLVIEEGDLRGRWFVFPEVPSCKVQLLIMSPKFVYEIPLGFVCFPFLQLNLIVYSYTLQPLTLKIF